MFKELFKRLTPGFKPSPTDIENERRIKQIYDKFITSKNPEIKRVLWRKYAEAHARRSPAMVAHLEKQRGLYRE